MLLRHIDLISWVETYTQINRNKKDKYVKPIFRIFFTDPIRSSQNASSTESPKVLLVRAE